MELMEGLTLLSTEVQNYAPVFWVLFIMSCFVLVACIWLIVTSAREGATVYTIVSLFLMAITMWLCAYTLSLTQQAPKTIYKVTIDESVSMVEFYERYEIIDQDGLIFTIIEKEVP